ncbi:MAG: hypothetical protein JNL70_19665 [Saprospiraceae bacterium]|nr:hypothetical protein [Saprospiraceae bacterium]
MIKGAFFTITGMVLSIGLCIAPSKPTQKQDTSNTATQVENNPEVKLKPSVVLSGQANLTPAEQARFLLRKIYLTGKVGSELPTLDPELEKRVGQKCLISRDQLRAYLDRNHITEWEVGGNIDLPVSALTDANGNQTFAKYMVIHDTSFPRYEKSFPSNINDDSWEWNRLNRWVANVTHLFINRVGDSKTMTPFQESVTATKLERFILGEGATKGLYLHIEMIQPRKYMKGYGRGNDVDSPTPGFTLPQYKRLAELYTVASVRKGEYLIPAFHACVDSGIKYAHDDPQNFELPKFFAALNEVWADMEKPAGGGKKIGSE